MNEHEIISTEQYRIGIQEAGPSGTIHITAPANIFQDMAARNATKLDFSQQRMAELGLGWALTRLYMVMERYPAPGETVVCSTWPSGLGKYNASRDFLLEDEQGRTLTRATSTWVTFDMNKREMVPPPAFMYENYPEVNRRSVEYAARGVKKLRSHDHECPIRTLRCHLDMNGHVNNTNLMAWCLEAVPEESEQAMILESLDISFRKECVSGLELNSVCAAVENEAGKFAHALLLPDGQEAARALSVWKPRP